MMGSFSSASSLFSSLSLLSTSKLSRGNENARICALAKVRSINRDCHLRIRCRSRRGEARQVSCDAAGSRGGGGGGGETSGSTVPQDEKVSFWLRCLSNVLFHNAAALVKVWNECSLRVEDDLNKIGFWNGVSKTRMACLASTLVANAICEKAFAAGEASTLAPPENSNFMFLVVCIGEAIALTGAAVGGILARQRKVELEKINAQLRQINVNLRRQSRMETYAPTLTYAPVGSGRMVDTQVRDDPAREELMQLLKTGKRWLREQSPVNAFAEFQKALVLAKTLKDAAEEKKAARGLGASCQRQGKYKEAINYHMQVLQISRLTKEGSGDTEAYGAIADCYTELGDLETAGKYYDQYIERLESDDAV